MRRLDGRTERDMRPMEISTGINIYAEGSALIKVGHTHVICTASVEDKVPPFLRDTTRGKASGRTQEIQRLIGRSLRAVADLKALGNRTIWIDCDVIQADGGT